MPITIDLTDRIALVTGAAGGIGQSIVTALESAGATVVAVDLNRESLATAFSNRPSVVQEAVDITDQVGIDNLFNRLTQQYGSLSIVVNNAGIAGRTGMPFTRLDADDWMSAWTVNVVGTFMISKAAADGLMKSPGASIVNIASVSGRTGFQTSPPYSASKAAVINFTQVMARDLAPHGVRVNAVCPGMVFTPFYAAQRLAAAELDPSVLEMSDEEFFEEKAGRLIPLGRGQQPDDIASAVVFLASDLAASITGQSLNVDGGLVMS